MIHWSVYTTAAGAIIGTALYFSVPANAEPTVAPQVVSYAASAAPAICATLSDFPTLLGVEGVALGIEKDSGFTPYQAGQVLGLAVEGSCPRFIPLLERFVSAFAEPGTGVVV